MNYLKLKTLLVSLVVYSSCGEHGNSSESKKVSEEEQASYTTEVLEDIKNTTVALYKWNETKSTNADFEPFLVNETDSMYGGLDLARHKQRLQELRDSKLFANEFIENYDKIGLEIDEKLRDKSLVWYVGELAPFGNGANPWCNCQDSPDNYWEKIALSDINVVNDQATYHWSWGDHFIYKAKAVQENGIWKIAYLEGFDSREFVPSAKID